MLRKIDKILMCIFMILMPLFIAGTLLTATYQIYVLWDDETAELPLLVGTILSLIEISGWIINMLIIMPINWLKGKIRDYKLDKYYKAHPEEEKKNTKDLADMFRKLANALEETKMSKALEALERIALGSNTLESQTLKFQEDYKLVEKELKALEIIKDKEVDILAIKYCNSAVHYNIKERIRVGRKILTEAEFNFLKEVLLC